MNLLDFIFKPAKRIESELTVSRMEALRRAASRAQPPDEVIGGVITSTESGWTLEIPPSSGGSSRLPSPHEIISVGEEKIIIQNGTINGLLCLPINEIEHSKTENLRYVVCKIEMDADTGPTTATYEIENNAPDAIEWALDDVPDEIILLIAVIEGSKIYQITTGNKFFQRRDVHEIPKDTVAVGEYPNDIYYSWVETSGDEYDG